MQRLTRREALSAIGIGMFAAARPFALETSLEFDAVDHVEFYVSHVERTRTFFASVFGGTLLRNASASKRYIKAGSAYLAFERPRSAGGPLVTAVVLQEEAVFRPVGVEHVLLNVADPEASARYYENVFGPVSRRSNDRIWFQLGRSRIGLLKTPDGQRPGVNHFCVSAQPFNYDTAVARLAALGAKIEPQELPGAPSFRDPDGMLVQVSPVS